MKTLHTLGFALFLLLAAASIGSAANCHCFQDRTFNPDAPALVDPYLLATARNGLLAGAAGTDKKAVVTARMTGEEESALWVALVVIDRTGVDGAELTGARKSSDNWADALDKLHLSADQSARLGPEFADRTDDEALARALADTALRRAFGYDEPTLATLRKEGAGNAELALAGLIASRTGETPTAIFRRSLTGTWGRLVDDAGLAAQEVGDLIVRKARPAP